MDSKEGKYGMGRNKVLYNDDATGLGDVVSGRAKESLIELTDLVTDNVPIDWKRF